MMIADLYDSSVLLHRALSTLPFLPKTHITAFEIYVRALAPTTVNPYSILHSTLLALQSTIDAILSALARPPRLINQINVSRRTVERNYTSLSRSTRWPLGLLDDTRQRMNEEREERMRAGQAEVNNLSRELRYTQQTVAMELAGWQDMHERMGRRAIRELARGMVVLEKMRLEGIKRAMRKLTEVKVDAGTGIYGPDDLDAPTGLDARVDTGVADDAAGGYVGLNAPITLAGLELQADSKANADPIAPTTSLGTVRTVQALQTDPTGSRIDAPLPPLPPVGVPSPAETRREGGGAST
jgi:hypothetical protein